MRISISSAMELCVELSIVLGQHNDHFCETENVTGQWLENVTEKGCYSEHEEEDMIGGDIW